MGENENSLNNTITKKIIYIDYKTLQLMLRDMSVDDMRCIMYNRNVVAIDDATYEYIKNLKSE